MQPSPVDLHSESCDHLESVLSGELDDSAAHESRRILPRVFRFCRRKNGREEV